MELLLRILTGTGTSTLLLLVMITAMKFSRDVMMRLRGLCCLAMEKNLLRTSRLGIAAFGYPAMRKLWPDCSRRRENCLSQRRISIVCVYSGERVLRM